MNERLSRKFTVVQGARAELEREALRAVVFGPPGAVWSYIDRLKPRGKLRPVDECAPCPADKREPPR